MPPVTRAAWRGSSPLTRGKQNVLPREGLHGRLIPAHAGKTAVRSRLVIFTPAHPRSRGENAACSAATLPAVGSSPLTRGKLVLAVRDPRRPGLIPAHAGKTV